MNPSPERYASCSSTLSAALGHVLAASYVLHDVLVMSGQPDRAEASQSTSWKCPAPALLSHQCTLLHHVYF